MSLLLILHTSLCSHMNHSETDSVLENCPLLQCELEYEALVTRKSNHVRDDVLMVDTGCSSQLCNRTVRIKPMLCAVSRATPKGREGCRHGRRTIVFN